MESAFFFFFPQEADLIALAAEELKDATPRPEEGPFDIFLSHSFADQNLVLGAFRLFTRHLGYKVYVDWLVDAHVRRDDPSERNAELVRHRMKQSAALVFLQTKNTSRSKWIPWELGFFDGANGKIAVFPSKEASASRISYLLLYPRLKISKFGDAYDGALFRSKEQIAKLEDWVAA